MVFTDGLIQSPVPGTHILGCRGDSVLFTLALTEMCAGTAFLRTNLGNAEIQRREIIQEVEDNTPILERDWFDIPMHEVSSNHYEIRMLLTEVGHFQAKCFWLEPDNSQPNWPPGENVEINVEPAHTCCANIIYNAFVRQFGPNKSRSQESIIPEQDYLDKLDSSGYTVIPPSGTFRDLQAELDFIIGELGCRIIQLLPVHPTPTTYARMGRFGSPFASLSFTNVDPALAVFDPKATPMEQFIELIDGIHARNGLIFLDIAINHTGWAAELHGSHPEWLTRDTEGKIEVPGAWGVEWADLTRLDYTQKGLWRYMAKVFLIWCRRGVDGFRCDAGYMVPSAAWKYIIAVVREQFPNTVFLLEGLGGKISVTRNLLNKANLNWAYSELFQNYSRNQLEHYLPEAINISESDGLTVHFAETHDNPRLASRSIQHARMRTQLCALLSSQGGFGFANGVEWFATEKIDVHQSPSLNWNAAPNQITEIGRLSHLLKQHPVFFHQTDLKLIQEGDGNFIVLLRLHRLTNKRLIVVVNLDDKNPNLSSWNQKTAGIEATHLYDLLTGEKVKLQVRNDMVSLRILPAEVRCLSSDAEDVITLNEKVDLNSELPPAVILQELRAKAMDVYSFFNGINAVTDVDFDQLASQLVQEPVEFCRNQNPLGLESCVTKWQWPEDKNRWVMIPPGFFMLVESSCPFHLQILTKKENEDEADKVLVSDKSLPNSDGSFFCLMKPFEVPDSHLSLMMRLKSFEATSVKVVEAPLLLLSQGNESRIKMTYDRSDLLQNKRLTLNTNGKGGMLYTNLEWSTVTSKYNALLAGNLDPEIPCDRWIMWSRCRVWAVFQGYSQELTPDCLDSFQFDYQSSGMWHYRVPTGQGQHARLIVQFKMLKDSNVTLLTLHRCAQEEYADILDDDKPLQLIIRPDIEDRNFHQLTKAYSGPETEWPKQIETSENGFSFTTHPDRRLEMKINLGEFVLEPEWHYMVNRPLEAERGMDPDSDLFSPGYFASHLKGDKSITVTGRIVTHSNLEHQLEDESSVERHLVDAEELSLKSLENVPRWLPLETAMDLALNHFVVKRGPLKSIIAGYPWFLDWGRDSLIVCRGLIAAGKYEDAKAVLTLFGQYEENGTLPNMIHGVDTGNRDTSDAPLWFLVACRDLAEKVGTEKLLSSKCGSRGFRDVLLSIGNRYMTGTSSGVCMDPDTGLIFSPSHFTWMDTNHPAGTPRQGFCIEIQALWFAGISFLAKIDSSCPEWGSLARKVQKSVEKLFVTRDGYLSDYLHAEPGLPAVNAVPDDGIRPNQLLAITMGLLSNRVINIKILEVTQQLLVPGAIRSLADRKVQREHPIYHDGQLLNDPLYPYQGVYQGDEDRQRKPAYHNGTAWTWLFPSFCEAWALTFGEPGKQTALALLSSSTWLINRDCIGQVPEITDGNYPHKARGCLAQAWGASELLRVWKSLV